MHIFGAWGGEGAKSGHDHARRTMELMMAWAAAAVVAGFVAAARQRSGFAWMVLSLVISPLLAFVLLLVLGRGDAGTRAPTSDTHRHCPACREIVRIDALRCMHCHCEITPITPPPG